MILTPFAVRCCQFGRGKIDGGRWLFGLAVSTLFAAGLVSAQDEPGEPRWFKGNTHAHSLWSDGNDFAENIISWYHTNGYHFAMLSDHNTLAEGERWISAGKAERAIARAEQRFGKDWVVHRKNGEKPEVRLRRLDEFRGQFEKPGAFLVMQAEEVTCSYMNQKTRKRMPVHINAVNVQSRILPINTGASVRDVMRRNLRSIANQEKKTGQPILAHLNHPNFHYAITGEDLGHVVEERFFEVYNGHPGINHLGNADHPSDERIWDIANRVRLQEAEQVKGGAPVLYGVATDDAHHYFGKGSSRRGRGWVMVRSTSLDPAAIVKAMRAGDFYSSSGIELEQLDYDASSRTITIKVAGVNEVTAEFIGLRSGKDATTGEVFEQANGRAFVFKLPKDALYGRVTLSSATPHVDPSFAGQVQQAWTQPVGMR